jgi:hypothetical protein
LPADTQFLPADGRLDEPNPSTLDGLPLPGVYVVRRERCVAELTARLLGIRWLRGRLTVRNAAFEIDPEGHVLVVELDAVSLWTTIPLLAKVLTGKTALRAEEFPSSTFTSDEVALLEKTVEIAGQIDVAGSPRDLYLEGQLRPVEPGRVILWLRGTLPPPRRRPAESGRTARFLARRPVHVEFAAEFVR